MRPSSKDRDGGRIAGRAAMAAVLVLPVLALSGAPAQAKSTLKQLKPYCMSDYLRLCRMSDPTRAAVVSCFKRKVASVSDRCKRAIAEHTEFDPEKIERRRR